MRIQRLLPLLGLVGLLAACTLPPVEVQLDDLTLPLTNTLGQAVVKEVKVNNPPVGSIAWVEVTGEASLDESATFELTFYATTDPDDAGCTLIGDYYRCDPTKLTEVGQVKFQNEQGPKPFALKGEVLAQGINQRSLYLGVRADGTYTGNVKLTNLKAKVALRVP